MNMNPKFSNIAEKLEQFQEDLLSNLEGISFDHFSEIRRQIDIQREMLKKKIDEIALKMVDQVNEKEKAYKATVKQRFLATTPVVIKDSNQAIQENVNPNQVFEVEEHTRNKQKQRVNVFQTKIKEIGALCDEIGSLVFTPNSSFRDDSFGFLKSNELIACALANNIQIWNLASNECIATLEGHSNSINCLETIDDNRFASGSQDKTIIIWDAKNFVLLKTLNTNSTYGVFSLKSLTLNRLASGSYQEIKIWNIESGECLQTLSYHSSNICGLVYLPNGNLVSCSDDAAIHVWELPKSGYIKSLNGHSGRITCVLLLRNGHLAIGSYDNAIEIWNIGSVKCVKILYGHSSVVSRLQQLESGELVSCSGDETIKIWDITEGTCIKTLLGHAGWVKSIRVNSLNNTLVSCSDHGLIKTWDTKMGECVSTISVQSVDDYKLSDLIFI